MNEGGSGPTYTGFNFLCSLAGGDYQRTWVFERIARIQSASVYDYVFNMFCGKC